MSSSRGPPEHKNLLVVTQNQLHVRADCRSQAQVEDDWRTIRARRRFGVHVARSAWSRLKSYRRSSGRCNGSCSSSSSNYYLLRQAQHHRHGVGLLEGEVATLHIA